MPEFAISVLCRDEEETCSHVRSTLMKDYRISGSKDRINFDHVGVKFFRSQEEALEEAARLKKESKGKILDIAVSPT